MVRRRAAPSRTIGAAPSFETRVRPLLWMRRSKGEHMPSLNELSCTEITQGIAAGQFTAEAVTRDCLERIKAREDTVRAWATIDPEHALAQARALDRGQRRGALHGVPIGVKDVIDTFDLPTEMGSAIYKGNRAACDAACVAVSRAAGAVILGKTVTAEVADMMVPAAFGTQTGGSVLRPAAYCGVVGYKPTFNLINRSGIKFAAESLDTIGVITRTVDDAELITAAVIGKEPARQTMASAPRLGLCRTPLWDTAQPETKHAVEDAATMTTACSPVRVGSWRSWAPADLVTAQQRADDWPHGRALRGAAAAL